LTTGCLRAGGGVPKPPFSDVSSRNAGDGIVPSDFVPRVQLEEKVQECLSKEETIQVGDAKHVIG